MPSTLLDHTKYVYIWNSFNPHSNSHWRVIEIDTIFIPVIAEEMERQRGEVTCSKPHS